MGVGTENTEIISLACLLIDWKNYCQQCVILKNLQLCLNPALLYHLDNMNITKIMQLIFLKLKMQVF